MRPFLFSLLSLLAVTTPLHAQLPLPTPDPNLGTVSVVGEGEVKIVPDHVLVSIGIETFDQDLATAKKTNDERLGRALAAAKDAGIAAKDIQTDFVSVEPVYDPNQYATRQRTGFLVRKAALITARDIGKFEQLLTALLDSGVNYIHGIEFKTSELRKHRDQARSMAARAAKEKAEALAKELGRSIGKPISISDQFNSWGSSYGSHWGGMRGGPMMMQNMARAESSADPTQASTLAPGEISVQARVNVTFRLE